MILLGTEAGIICSEVGSFEAEAYHSYGPSVLLSATSLPAPPMADAALIAAKSFSFLSP